MAVTIGISSGFVSARPSANPLGTSGGIGARARATKDTSPSGTNAVVEAGVWIANDTEESDFQVGVYSHDAANDRPNALLGTAGSGAKGTTSGWKYASYSTEISASTTYWVAAQVDGTATETRTSASASSGGRHGRLNSQTSLPSSWGAFASVTDDEILSIYALYEAAGGSTIWKSQRRKFQHLVVR